eukprot:571989-Prymnesium_polylepis.1
MPEWQTVGESLHTAVKNMSPHVPQPWHAWQKLWPLVQNALAASWHELTGSEARALAFSRAALAFSSAAWLVGRDAIVPTDAAPAGLHCLYQSVPWHVLPLVQHVGPFQPPPPHWLHAAAHGPTGG